MRGALNKWAGVNVQSGSDYGTRCLPARHTPLHLLYLLELGLGLLLIVGVLVGVPLHGQPAVGLLDVQLGGAQGHLQHLVVLRDSGERGERGTGSAALWTTSPAIETPQHLVWLEQHAGRSQEL